jgi:7-carboxy-7-deazaguanine synthase
VYSVKEAFLTLQGEGFHAGRAAVFCRFSGCNLWSGRETDRGSAICTFCDTDFVGVNGNGGGKFAVADSLVEHIENIWGNSRRNRMVVFTGGEPLLQLDPPLVEAVHERGFLIAVETNGTIEPPSGVDWLTVSPKGVAPMKALRGQELKLVFPQVHASPEQFDQLDFNHFFLQPMHGPQLAENTRDAVQYCLTNPKWRLSVQMHKYVGIA